MTFPQPNPASVAGEISTPWIRERLLEAAAAMDEGTPAVKAHGQLIRPLLAIAALPSPESPPEGFWDAVLAVQLAHEASLVHDDIVDAARVRRGEPTLLAAAGIPRALVHGDHLLTSAYRAAARTGSLPFAALFARAVERTVAGESEQGRSVGRALTRPEYEGIALGKAGELLGCALAAGPVLAECPDAMEIFELGRGVGLLYQMLDDLLDYCPGADTGKTALADYRQRRWTWVLEEAPGLAFGADEAAVVARLHGPGLDGSPVMVRALNRLEEEARRLRGRAAGLPRPEVIETLVGGWLARARQAVATEAAGLRARTEDEARGVMIAELRARMPAAGTEVAFQATHSRSFRFASRFFAQDSAARVAGVYAYCRTTDDLVDDAPPAHAERLLAEWERLSRRAYRRQPTGLPLLDRVMGEMAHGGVPFEYAAELIEGMRMDLRGERYATLLELRGYSYRVASVVGLWLTRLFGVHDHATLARAERLGHAMQLTNILRDVGEDWRRGRLYLPAELLRRHRVSDADLERMCAGAPIGTGYRALVEELMDTAEEDYRAALTALPGLPADFARPVAVAAHVYRGIHREIRRNGHDNLRLRAHTGPAAKGALAARALWELYWAARPDPVGGTPPAVAHRWAR